MIAIIGFVYFVVDALLGLLILAIVISAVLSWLFAFDVINHRNRFVNQLAGALDAVVSPVLRPIRAFVPPLGGMDISPVIAWILLSGVRMYLLPASHGALLNLLGGGYAG